MPYEGSEGDLLINCVCTVNIIPQNEPGLESSIRETSGSNADANSRISVPLQSRSPCACCMSSLSDLVQVMRTFLSNLSILSINETLLHITD